jgi:hypothetical protein
VCAPFLLLHGRQDAGEVRAAVVDGLGCYLHFGGRFVGDLLAGLQVDVVERGAGAGHGDADAVPLLEDLAEPADFEGRFVYVAGLLERFFLPGVAEAGADGGGGGVVFRAPSLRPPPNQPKSPQAHNETPIPAPPRIPKVTRSCCYCAALPRHRS